ncbi:hypothetical protein ILYODFUR_025251, partial [Ilyodon furcidens]
RPLDLLNILAHQYSPSPVSRVNNPLVSPPPSGGSLHQSIGIPVPVPCTFHYTVNKLITVKLCLLNCFLHVSSLVSCQNMESLFRFAILQAALQRRGTTDDSSCLCRCPH